jgi:hypothetical protein
LFDVLVLGKWYRRRIIRVLLIVLLEVTVFTMVLAEWEFLFFGRVVTNFIAESPGGRGWVPSKNWCPLLVVLFQSLVATVLLKPGSRCFNWRDAFHLAWEMILHAEVFVFMLNPHLPWVLFICRAVVLFFTILLILFPRDYFSRPFLLNILKFVFWVPWSIWLIECLVSGVRWRLTEVATVICLVARTCNLGFFSVFASLTFLLQPQLNLL